MALLLARLLVRRLLLAIPLVFSVVTLTFFLIHLAPGDPAAILAGEAPTPEFMNAVRAEYFKKEPPISTCFQASLMREEVLVEIEAVAFIPRKS